MGVQQLLLPALWFFEMRLFRI